MAREFGMTPEDWHRIYEAVNQSRRFHSIPAATLERLAENQKAFQALADEFAKARTFAIPPAFGSAALGEAASRAVEHSALLSREAFAKMSEEQLRNLTEWSKVAVRIIGASAAQAPTSDPHAFVESVRAEPDIELDLDADQSAALEAAATDAAAETDIYGFQDVVRDVPQEERRALLEKTAGAILATVRLVFDMVFIDDRQLGPGVVGLLAALHALLVLYNGVQKAIDAVERKRSPPSSDE